MTIDTNYIQPGINIATCEHCGFDRQGRPTKDGGNVFIQVSLRMYERIRIDCTAQLKGRCHKCSRISRGNFVHVPAPEAAEGAIKELAQQFN